MQLPFIPQLAEKLEAKKRPTAPAPAAPKSPEESALQTFQEVGILVFHKVGDDFSRVDGVFALPMFHGGVGKERLEKVEGPLDCYEGLYNFKTTTDPDSGFPEVVATGTFEIKPIDAGAASDPAGICGTAHWVIWDMLLEDWVNELNGYSSSAKTRLKYIGVGIEIADTDRLAVAWSNNVFSRTYLCKGQEMVQYGVCGTSIPASAGGS